MRTVIMRDNEDVWRVATTAHNDDHNFDSAAQHNNETTS